MVDIKDIAWVISSVGAMNWGLVEATNTNILTDVGGLGADIAGIAYVLIGVAGAISLAYYADEVM